MNPSRRNSIQEINIQSDTNASLWLDKYFDQAAESPKAKLVSEIAGIHLPAIYSSFFDRWKTAMEQNCAVLKEAEVQGRLAINLGAESVLETSIALNRTYGIPYIPGSALKGLASHYACNHLDAELWGKDSPAYKVMFGETQNAGYVTFFDALYVPGSGFKGKALWPDIITLHHPDYYQSSSSPPPPADWDSPTPVPFLSATGRYLVALSGDEGWVAKAFEILGLALQSEGIGAKTSSGYGRMKFTSSSPQVSSADADKQAVDAYMKRKQLLLLEQPPAGRLRGTVVEVRQDGRFGFINPARGGTRMFVHSSQLKGKQDLREGQIVEYQIGKYQGRDQAQEVNVLLDPE